MADPILQNTSTDTIAVFDSSFKQVFQNARPLRDEVVPRAKLMDHPLESGQIISDYKILLPTEITISMIISAQYYRDTYQEIWNLWISSAVLTVQTRVASYPSMVISEPPHEERPEIFDAITMHLRFRQVQTPAQAAPFSPANPVHADTQPVGQQTGNTISLPSGGTAEGVASTQPLSGIQITNTGVQNLNTQQNVQSDFHSSGAIW